MPETNGQVISQDSSPMKTVSQSPKSSPTKKDIDISTQALNFFAQGKRHLLVNDITSAVNSLQEACRLLGEHYGETAIECADAYFYYGKALLELARIESGVLGNALDGVPEGEDQNNSQVGDPEKMTEEEVEMVSDVVGEALEENYKLNENRIINANTESCTTGDSDTNDKVDGNCLSSVKVQDNDSVTKENKEIEAQIHENGDTTVENESGSGMKTNGVSDTSNLNIAATFLDKSLDNDEGKNGRTTIDGKALGEPVAHEEAMEEDTKDEQSEKEEQDEKGDDEEEEQEESSNNEENENEEPADEEAQNEPEGDKTEDSEDDDDVDNLQLSWEILELSKVIYQKQLENNADSAISLKLAQVFLKLGEVGLESENYNQSVEDFKQCLHIQSKELQPDDRRLAETHYQIGVAHSLSNDFKSAFDSFEVASNIIAQRIDNLHKLQEEKKSWTEEQILQHEKEKDPFYTEQNEIEELSKLLPEIKEKMSEMQEMLKDYNEKVRKLKESFPVLLAGGEAGSSTDNGFASTSKQTSFSTPFASEFQSTSSDDKPISNIGHLIRKKRKPEDEVTSTKIEVKKSKSENLNDNDSSSGPLQNGNDQSKDVSSETTTTTAVSSNGSEN